MPDPRVCIVGAGRLSSRRIYPYIGAAGGQLVGVCDLDREKAEQNARRFGGAVYDDLEAMLAEQRPDGVIICVGPHGHAELAPRVLRLGYPVYTEKPPAPTAAEALAVARVARETGLLCMTAFKKRYSTAWQRAKEWLAKFPESEWHSASVDYASGPYRNEDARTAFLLDFAIHVIDAIGYLMGDARRVFAFTRDHHAYVVSIEFANGALGALNLTDGRSFGVPTEELELTVQGGNFLTMSNSSRWRITEGQRPCEWREPQTFISGGDSGNDTGHLAEIVEFLAAIQEGRSTRSEIYASYKSMVLYEAIRDSADTGRVIEIAYETL